jgi:hypothetical protein
MVFSCLIAAQIQRQKGVITNAEWNLLLRGPGVGVRGNKPDALSWLTAAQWNMCSSLEASVPAFEGLVNDMSAHSAAWRDYISSPEPRIQHIVLLSGIKEKFSFI